MTMVSTYRAYIHACADAVSIRHKCKILMNYTTCRTRDRLSSFWRSRQYDQQVALLLSCYVSSLGAFVSDIFVGLDYI